MSTKNCAVILFIKDNQLLLLQDAIHQDRLKPPGGKVETGESFLEAAIRETTEELAVTIMAPDLKAIHLAEFFWQDAHHITCIFLAQSWAGEPINNDPVDHTALVWVPLAPLPSQLFEPLQIAIPQALAGAFYSTWRAEN